MNQPATQDSVQEEWLKVLGKGMITIPKRWRDALGFSDGNVVKAKKVGNQVVLEAKSDEPAPYRLYSDEEINDFLRQDRLPESNASRYAKNLR